MSRDPLPPHRTNDVLAVTPTGAPATAHTTSVKASDCPPITGRSTRAQAIGLVGLSLLLCLMWTVQALTIPTFDFDEALYRRLAEEMKTSGQYFKQTWDGRGFYEKPPTYIWTIVLASTLIDGPRGPVSTFACRLPSLFSSWASVILLACFWQMSAFRYARNPNSDGLAWWQSSVALPVLAYNTALLPVAGAGSVLLDPLLTFFLCVVLIVFARATARNDGTGMRLTRRETFLVGGAIAAATALKGPIGFVLPIAALLMHVALSEVFAKSGSGRLQRVARSTAYVLRQSGPALLLALGVSSAFYAFLYAYAGRPFFREFFLRQNFVRGLKPIQGHSGSVLYHPVVVLLLGGSLIGYLLLLAGYVRIRDASYARWGFPLSWAIAVIAFYSAMATKLPNYTWPVWPAFTLAFCILASKACASTGSESEASRPSRGISRTCSALAFASPLVLTVTFTVLGLGVELWLRSLPMSARTRAMVNSLEPLPWRVRWACIALSLTFILQIWSLRRFRRRLIERSPRLWQPLASSALANGIGVVIACVLLIPYFDIKMREPLARLARDAAHRHHRGGDFTTIGLFSPTVSSYYAAGSVNQIGKTDLRNLSLPGAPEHLILVPLWISTCQEPGIHPVGRDGFLVLCTRAGNRPPRRSANVPIRERQSHTRLTRASLVAGEAGDDAGRAISVALFYRVTR